GYAVGAIRVCSSLSGGFELVRGMQILFMRRVDWALDPEDSYWSEWIGVGGVGREVLLGGDGNPVVGIHGRAGGAIDSLGIIQIQPVHPGESVKYLSDMQEFEVKVAQERSGVPRWATKGNLGYTAGGSNRIRVKGEESPNGLSMHAISNGHSTVKY